MQVTCILVNFNNWQDTAACLASLALQTTPLQVLVVDNASTNDSLAQLRAAFPQPVYIASPTNLGFPRACNLAARHPLALPSDFLWFLNNDTVAPPDTLAKLLATASANPQAGIVGAVLYYAHSPAQVQAWGGGQISLWTGFNRHYLAPTALNRHSYITFASALVRRPAFDRLDGLYEGVFMYFEDSDFCLRAQRAGWTLAVSPQTAILHREGASAAVSSAKDRITTLSGLMFLSRHAPTPLIACTLFAALRLTKRLLRGPRQNLPAVLTSIRDFLTHHSKLKTRT